MLFRSPYFSSSQIVWTIIIGTIMIAMALGNVYGGRKADKDPNPDKLYRRILLAAVWIALIPVLGKYIILGISAVMIFSVNANFLIWAAFAACMVIFVFPLFLLGTVTPCLAKYTMENLQDNARIVGTLGAANTIGSIIGTFVPTFVTIPAVGTAATFLIFSGILLILALAYFFSGKGKRGGALAALVLYLLSGVFGHKSDFAFWKTDLLYEGESIYNYLQVEETERSVILSTNVLFGVQSIKMKDEGLTGMYYDYALAAPVMAGANEKDGLDVLILGMGTGTYGRQCLRYFDGAPEDAKVTTYDGRAFLAAVDARYDVILVDAYQDITIPFQMASEEFFALVKEHLKDGGVMAVNMNMRGEEDSINQYLADTISAVFPQVYTVNVVGGTNRELFASCAEDLPGRLERGIPLCEDGQLRAMMARVSANLTPYEAGDRVMTDDRAPVELLSIRVIDDLIRQEVEYYRAVYEQEGLEGLISGL